MKKPGVDGKIIMKLISDGDMNLIMWLRIGTGGGLL